MKWKMSTYGGVALIILWSVAHTERTEVAAALDQKQGTGTGVPIFEVDASWPKIPGNWILGGVAGIDVDTQDHIWVIHRPRTINKEDLGGTLNPPRECCVPAPPVLEFDAAGNFIQGWGGPGPGYDWPENEHGITVDYKGNIWIGGNASQSGAYAGGAANQAADCQILKFTKTGKFLLQIGHPKMNQGSNDTENFGRPTQVYVYPKTNEAFVTDGYTNRRVIVFDADTGKYKRHWGAYGKKPDDSVPNKHVEEGPGVLQFNIPHSITISTDGLVYVADRTSRIQVFKPDGTFLKEGFVARRRSSGNTTTGIDLSTDTQQKFLYAGDADNDILWILNRDTLETVGRFGRRGRQAGQWEQLHMLAVDSKGNIYTQEVSGRRVQKFLFTPR